ncbi:hypothetical protein D3C85_1169240 [compost metagenome]
MPISRASPSAAACGSGFSSVVTSACLKVMRWATPAALALSRAFISTRGSASQPNSFTSQRCMPRLARTWASIIRLCHRSPSCCSQRSKPKRSRRRAGAMSAAMKAASISRVPEPHMGSIMGSPAQPLRAIMAQARFSLSGASPVPWR